MWYKNPLREYQSWQAYTPMQIDLALFVFLSRRRTHAHDTIHRSHACRTYCIQTLQTLLPHNISFPAVLGLSGLLLTFRRIKAVLSLRAILLTFLIKPVLDLHAILLTLMIGFVALPVASLLFFMRFSVENCHAPQYLATRQHNSRHLTLRSSLHDSFLFAIDVTAF